MVDEVERKVRSLELILNWERLPRNRSNDVVRFSWQAKVSTQPNERFDGGPPVPPSHEERERDHPQSITMDLDLDKVSVSLGLLK